MLNVIRNYMAWGRWYLSNIPALIESAVDRHIFGTKYLIVVGHEQLMFKQLVEDVDGIWIMTDKWCDWFEANTSLETEEVSIRIDSVTRRVTMYITPTFRSDLLKLSDKFRNDVIREIERVIRETLEPLQA